MMLPGTGDSCLVLGRCLRFSPLYLLGSLLSLRTSIVSQRLPRGVVWDLHTLGCS